jgi:RNA polymerase sigma factor (sigma-70 family)
VAQAPAASSEVSDTDAIRSSLSEPSAFAVIFDRHFDAIHAYLARRVGGGRADDLSAATFTVAFERRHRFRRDATTARPWLFGIATNLMRNERRAERRALEAVGRLGSSMSSPAPHEPPCISDLGELLAELDHGQRDVLLLYAWEELSYEEIAEALAIPVGTVRSRLARARASLRERLEDRSGNQRPATEVGR